MVRRTTLFLLFCLFYSAHVLGQARLVSCGDSVTKSSIQKDNYWQILYCNCRKYSDTNLIPPAIRKENHEYLARRLGPALLQRVVLTNILLIEPFSPSQGNNPLCNLQNKYAFEYELLLGDSLRYYFVTIYDKKGKMLSKPQLPKRKQTIDTLLTACQAIDIAEQSKRNAGQAVSISFNYHARKKCFVWKIEKPVIVKPDELGHTQITPYILVNAQTGKIVGYEKDEIYNLYEYPQEFYP